MMEPEPQPGDEPPAAPRAESPLTVFSDDSSTDDGEDLPGILVKDLKDKLGSLDDVRLKVFLKIWGHGAEDLPTLRAFISPALAEAFHFDNLADVLRSTVKSNEPKQVPDATDQDKKIPVPSPKDDSKKKVDSLVIRYSKQVDKFFKEKMIPAKTANIIRKRLQREVEVWYKDNAKYLGLQSGTISKIWQGTRPPIYVHFAEANPGENKLLGFFGESKRGYGGNSEEFKAVIVALLCREESDGWKFEGGYQQWMAYHKFIANKWIPETCKRLVTRVREEASDKLKKHIDRTAYFCPRFFQKKEPERLKILCQQYAIQGGKPGAWELLALLQSTQRECWRRQQAQAE